MFSRQELISSINFNDCVNSLFLPKEYQSHIQFASNKPIEAVVVDGKLYLLICLQKLRNQKSKCNSNNDQNCHLKKDFLLYKVITLLEPARQREKKLINVQRDIKLIHTTIFFFWSKHPRYIVYYISTFCFQIPKFDDSTSQKT